MDGGLTHVTVGESGVWGVNGHDLIYLMQARCDTRHTIWNRVATTGWFIEAD